MGQGASQTPVHRTGARNLYLDALRAVALCRVVMFHASGKWWVTFATAMPLMFFVAGSLYAGSLERRAATEVVRDRYRRILLPYWVYLAAMVGLWGALGVLGQVGPRNWVAFALPVLSLHGPVGPGSGTALQLTWIALWYLQAHLLFSLVGAPLRRALRAAPAALWAVVAGLFGLGLIVSADLAAGAFFLACWLFGYVHHDGGLRPAFVRQWPWICVACGLPGAVIFFGLHDAPRAVPVASTLLGVFWLALALGVEPLVAPRLGGARTRRVLTWFSRRSLTVYLWHMAALYVVDRLDLPGQGTGPGRLVWTVALTVAVVPVVGWVEDVAARRPPELWPGRRVPVTDLGAAAGTGAAVRQQPVVDLRAPVAEEVAEEVVDLTATEQPATDD